MKNATTFLGSLSTTRGRSIKTHLKIPIAMNAVVIMVSACTFDGVPGFDLSPEGINRRFADASRDVSYDSYRTPVHRGQGFEVQHGASCAAANRAASINNGGRYEFGIAIQETAELPSWANNATVFMNGWRLRYRDDDHQVVALSSAIVDVEVRDGALQWSAGGIISDKNGDDAYSWCYSYTLLFWNDARYFGIAKFDSDNDAVLTVPSLSENPRGSEQSEYHVVDDLPFEPRALLPRGFGYIFPPYTEDHKLVQVALKHGEFITSTPSQSPGYIGWLFETVFHGKDHNRRYHAAQIASVLGGSKVSLEQRDFEIYDIPQLGGSNGFEGVVTRDLVIEDLPYDMAIPVLAGWNLVDAEKEIQPQDVGVWIESFEYDKAPGAERGTLILRYKAVFADDNGHFSSAGAIEPQVQINILGIDNLQSLYAPWQPTSGEIGGSPPSTTVTGPVTLQINGQLR